MTLLLGLLFLLTVSLQPSETQASIHEVLVLGDMEYTPISIRSDVPLVSYESDGVYLDYGSGDFTVLSYPDSQRPDYIDHYWSSDEQKLAVLNNYNSTLMNVLQIWSINHDTGQTASLFEYAGEGRVVTWKPDSSQVALGGRIFDVNTGENLLTHYYALKIRDASTGEETIYRSDLISRDDGIYWSPNGNTYATIHYGFFQSSRSTFAVFDSTNTAFLYELESSELDSTEPQFVWKSDSSLITDGFRTWNAETGTFQAVSEDWGGWSWWKITSFWVDDYLWSLDAIPKWIGGPLSILRIWNPYTGETLFRHEFWRAITEIEPRGNIIQAVTANGYGLILDRRTGNVVSAEALRNVVVPNTIRWSPDSRSLLSLEYGPPEYPMQLWNVAGALEGDTKTPVWTVNEGYTEYEQNASKDVADSIQTHWLDDETIITETSDYYSVLRSYAAVQQWDAMSGEHLETLYYAHDVYSLPKHMAPNPDLSQFVVYGPLTGDPIQITDLQSGDLIAEYIDEQDCYVPIWNAVGTQIAIVSLYSNVKPVIWTLADDSRVELNSEVTIYSPQEIAWNERENLIAIWNTVFDTSTGEVVFQNDVESVRALDWFGDDLLAMLTRDSVQIWDVLNHTMMVDMALDFTPLAMDWSPDGRYIAVSEGEGLIHIYEYTTQ